MSPCPILVSSLSHVRTKSNPCHQAAEVEECMWLLAPCCLPPATPMHQDLPILPCKHFSTLPTPLLHHCHHTGLNDHLCPIRPLKQFQLRPPVEVTAAPDQGRFSALISHGSQQHRAPPNIPFLKIISFGSLSGRERCDAGKDPIWMITANLTLLPVLTLVSPVCYMPDQSIFSKCRSDLAVLKGEDENP